MCITGNGRRKVNSRAKTCSDTPSIERSKHVHLLPCVVLVDNASERQSDICVHSRAEPLVAMKKELERKRTFPTS